MSFSIATTLLAIFQIGGEFPDSFLAVVNSFFILQMCIEPVCEMLLADRGRGAVDVLVGDARLPVALCVGTYRSGKDSRRQKDFLSHCDLFLMPGGGWEVRLSRLVNNLKF